MSNSFTARGTDYLLSGLTIGKPTVFRVQILSFGLQMVMMNRFLAAPRVPPHWPVVMGDVLEVERIGRVYVRITVLEGKERMDCIEYLRSQWKANPAYERMECL